jgi:PAS domain S-box-containing protein
MTTASVLVVEDERIVALDLKVRLSSLGYTVAGTVPSGEQALQTAKEQLPDIVLMDIHLEGALDGIDAARALHETLHIPVIFLTAYSEDSTLMRAEQTLPFGFLVKPVDERALHASIQMALARHAAENALRESEQRFRDVVDAAGEFIWETDANGRYVYVSKRAEEIMGYPEAQLLGHSPTELMPPEERERLGSWFCEQIRSHKPFRGFEHMVVRPDGTPAWHRVSGVPRTDARGRYQGYRGTGLDVTDRKRIEARLQQLNEELEQRVRVRTAALERANRELEAFSYSVSHDLRAPLRSIEGFAAILQETQGERLDADGQRCVERIRAGTMRMSDLFEALIMLARIARFEVNAQPVDVSAIARECIEELARHAPEREVSVVIEPGIIASADRYLVHSLLENLLGNAWKFTSRTPQARIELARTGTTEGMLQLTVRDNGVGFDPSQGERLFTPFQRLHRESDFPGTGIGLATAKRIVERHGGAIRAESVPGRGTAFHFTLPAAAATARDGSRMH